MWPDGTPHIAAPYEPPENSELVIHSYKEDATAAAKRVLKLIEQRKII